MKRLLIALLLAMTTAALADSLGPKPDSMYVPLCLEKRCQEENKNAIFLLTGPNPMDTQGALLVGGYMRKVKADLSLGGIVLGTNQRFLGWAIGFGYHF